MPIYEYECQNPHCKMTSEFLVLGDEVKQSRWCKTCGTRMKQIMSAANGKVNGKYTAKTGYTYAGQNKPLGVA